MYKQDPESTTELIGGTISLDKFQAFVATTIEVWKRSYPKKSSGVEDWCFIDYEPETYSGAFAWEEEYLAHFGLLSGQTVA